MEEGLVLKYNLWSNSSYYVLILVVMEDGLVLEDILMGAKVDIEVLILVVMEDGIVRVSLCT